MSKQVDKFFEIFDDVTAAFNVRGLVESVGGVDALDAIQKIAVHLNINNECAAEKGPGAVADGAEGKVSGQLEATAKRSVETKNGTRTAFDITVDGQKYGTFEKKIFPVGLKVGDKVDIVFKQNGKFRNLQSLTITDAVSDNEAPF